MANEIMFPATWIDGQCFEQSLRSSIGYHQSGSNVIFRFPRGCSIMVDAGARLLSLVNQLQYHGSTITLHFDEGYDGTQGYLNRMGFFKLLHSGIDVVPYPPFTFMADIYRGKNPNLVEFRAVNPRQRDRSIPSCLADALVRGVTNHSIREPLGNMAFTVFGELIDNIYEHSATALDGYAVLQVYRQGGSVKVAVSDSGKGIIETLRTGLQSDRRFTGLPDTDLVVEAFRNGLSRHGAGRGCGLKRCADNAIRFRADLGVRLHTCYVCLKPSRDGDHPSTAYTYENLPPILGSHVTFDFHLDN